MILGLEYPWYSLHSSQPARAVEIRFSCKASIILLLKIIICIYSGMKAYSVDLAWKCGTAVCERLVVTSYSRRVDLPLRSRGKDAVSLCCTLCRLEVLERRQVLGAVTCIINVGRVLFPPPLQFETYVTWECPLCPGSRLSRPERQLRACALWNVTGSSSSLSDAFYHWTPCTVFTPWYRFKVTQSITICK